MVLQMTICEQISGQYKLNSVVLGAWYGADGNKVQRVYCYHQAVKPSRKNDAMCFFLVQNNVETFGFRLYIFVTWSISLIALALIVINQ